MRSKLKLTQKIRCEHYAAAHEFRNLDHMLDWIVFQSPFTVLVIIDEIPDNLEGALARKFKFWSMKSYSLRATRIVTGNASISLSRSSLISILKWGPAKSPQKIPHLVT